jgi:hypothetical protein
MNQLLDRIATNAPDEIADTVETAVNGVREDPSLGDPVVQAAVNALDDWVIDNCGYDVVTVTATDYAFDGIPRTLRPRTVLFDFTNDGAELHELVLVRVKNDTPLRELLELPEEDFEANFEFISAVQAQQGDAAVLYTQLRKPGRYAAVCFLPVGSTSPDVVESATGPPHHAEGMIAEFQVRRTN